MLKIEQNKKSKKSIQWLIFLLFLFILIIDRAYTLFYFGFVYTDIDQLVMWNGAVDYSQGIFHEPFFYGQPYNYMLESLLATPFLFLNIPVYLALPLATSIIVLLPYVIFAILLFKKKYFLWAYLVLTVPVILPLEYQFLTTISRGFVQAHFFIPLLFIPLLNPERKKNVSCLFIASALCFIANQSALLIIFPIIIYVSTYHFKSISFYLKSLWAIPILLMDYLFKYFYKIHPERVLHDISGLKFDFATLLNTFNNSDLFQHLFPFTSNGGSIYLVIFSLLAMIAFKRKKKKEFLFVLSILFILLISFAIPKVQTPYPLERAGIFFSVSRFYLTLPLLVFISFYMVFKSWKPKTISKYILLGICMLTLFIQNSDIQNSVNQTIEKTSFPIAKNRDLIERSNKLSEIRTKHKVDLMVHKMLPSWEWNNLFDSYAFHPLQHHQNKNTISVNYTGDRRSWLYEEVKSYNRILLIGFEMDEALLKPFDYIIIENKGILILDNQLKPKDLFQKLNLKWGNYAHI